MKQRISIQQNKYSDDLDGNPHINTMKTEYISAETELELDEPVHLQGREFDHFTISVGVRVETGEFYGQNHPLNVDDVVELDELCFMARHELDRQLAMNFSANLPDFTHRVEQIARFLATEANFDLEGWIGQLAH